VRRSLLKHLHNQQERERAAAAESQASERVARKVIIRHVSHNSPPSPAALSGRSLAGTRNELAPETIRSPFDPSLPAPWENDAPQTAPLNETTVIGALVAAETAWQPVAPALIMVAGPSESVATGPLVVSRPLDLASFEEGLAEAIITAEAVDELDGTFHGKALGQDSDREDKLYVDQPHARQNHRPHAKFGKAKASAAAEAPSKAGSAAEEITLAEASDDQHAIDLAAHVESKPGTMASAGDLSATERRTIPLWEVDRFQWPRACEKLMGDQNGYFAHAGDKLLAAVRDGLHVLAITGSRRGEGRTTLAVCLARAAAKAGIQVALMDADFARPQLAAKIGIEVASGWQDAALGKIPLSEAAIKSLSDGITALPMEASAAGRSLSLADPRVTATLRAAAATFELLILDLGPAGAGEEFAFPHDEACPLDAAIVVRDLRFASAAESESIGRMLQNAGVEAVGIAENFVGAEPE
jgi:Mrp family chromosome partitioning ATPase